MIFWLFLAIIVISGIASDMYGKRLKHRERMVKVESELVHKQLKLEQIKHENFKLETEKLRLELNQDIQNAPSKNQLLEVKLAKEK